MSKSNDNATRAPIWGVDPAIIAAAVAKGRRERSEAFWSLLTALFGRRQAGQETTRAVDRNAIAMR